MTKAASLVVLAMLPLIVGVNGSPVDDEGVPSGGATGCHVSPGLLVVAVSDYKGQPMKNEGVRVSSVVVPDEKLHAAWESYEKGRARTGDDGCAYIKLENVEKGKRTYYVYVEPHQYRDTKKGVRVDATTPEAAGVVQVRVKNKPPRAPEGCHYATMT